MDKSQKNKNNKVENKRKSRMLNLRPALSIINFMINNIKFKTGFIDNKMAQCYYYLNK